MKKSEQLRIAAEIEEANEKGQPIEWQQKESDGKWASPFDPPASCITHGIEIRIKPKVIVLNGHEVPEPLRQAPPHKAPYWFTDPSCRSGVGSSRWDGDNVDNYRLSSGIVHSTPEAAALHAKALISFTQA